MSHVDPGPLSAYNSLTDPHLSGFFSNTRMRKYLCRQGLVTKRGQIVSESTYRLNMARKEHKRHVKNLLASAIVHKTLDMERHRQVEIKRKLEEIAKIELVRRVRAGKAPRLYNGTVSWFYPTTPRSYSAPVDVDRLWGDNSDDGRHSPDNELVVVTHTVPGDRVRQRDDSILPYLTASSPGKVSRRKSAGDKTKGHHSREGARSASPTMGRASTSGDKAEANLFPLLSRSGSGAGKSRRPASGPSARSKPRKHRKPRPFSAPAQDKQQSENSLREGRSFSHDDGRPESRRATRREVTNDDITKHGLGYAEIDTRNLTGLDTVALRKYAYSLSKHEQGVNAVSPYLMPQVGYRVPSPPKSPRGTARSRHSRRRHFSPRDSLSARSTSPPQQSHRVEEPRASPRASEGAVDGNLILHRQEPAMKGQEKVQSFCTVTLKYHGKKLSLPRDQVDPYQEVLVEQQHCGGNTLHVFKERLLPGSTFRFISRRHRGFPFSLSLYIDGIMDCRVSSCCEYKHVPGAKLGGKQGHFSLTGVTGAAPCYRCQVEKELRLQRKSKKKPKSETEVAEEDNQGETTEVVEENEEETNIVPVEESDNEGETTRSDGKHKEIDVNQMADDRNEYEEDFEDEDEKEDKAEKKSEKSSDSEEEVTRAVDDDGALPELTHGEVEEETHQKDTEDYEEDFEDSKSLEDENEISEKTDEYIQRDGTEETTKKFKEERTDQKEARSEKSTILLADEELREVDKLLKEIDEEEQKNDFNYNENSKIAENFESNDRKAKYKYLDNVDYSLDSELDTARSDKSKSDTTDPSKTIPPKSKSKRKTVTFDETPQIQELEYFSEEFDSPETSDAEGAPDGDSLDDLEAELFMNLTSKPATGSSTTSSGSGDKETTNGTEGNYDQDQSGTLYSDKEGGDKSPAQQADLVSVTFDDNEEQSRDRDEAPVDISKSAGENREQLSVKDPVNYADICQDDDDQEALFDPSSEDLSLTMQIILESDKVETFENAEGETSSKSSSDDIQASSGESDNAETDGKSCDPDASASAKSTSDDDLKSPGESDIAETVAESSDPATKASETNAEGVSSEQISTKYSSSGDEGSSPSDNLDLTIKEQDTTNSVEISEKSKIANGQEQMPEEVVPEAKVADAAKTAIEDPNVDVNNHVEQDEAQEMDEDHSKTVIVEAKPSNGDKIKTSETSAPSSKGSSGAVEGSVEPMNAEQIQAKEHFEKTSERPQQDVNAQALELSFSDEPSNNVTATEISSTQDDDPSNNVTATEMSSTQDDDPSNNVTATEMSSTQDDEPSSNVTATEMSSTQDDDPSNNVTATEMSSTQDDEPSSNGSSSNVTATETSSTQDIEPSNNVTATEASSTQDDEPSNNITATETSITRDDEPSSNVTATETSSTQDDEPTNNVIATETSSTQDDEPSSNVSATETSSTQDNEPSNNVTATETSSTQDNEPSSNVTATETSSTQDDEPSNNVTATETSSTQDNEPSSNVIATETSSTQDDEPSNNVTATETSSTQDDEPSNNVTATETSSTQDDEPSSNVTATETSSTRDDEPSSNVTATETSSTQDNEPSNNITATETSSTWDDEPSSNVTATETSSTQDDEPSNNVIATETSSTQDDEPSSNVSATETSSTQDNEPSNNVTATETSSTQDNEPSSNVTATETSSTQDDEPSNNVTATETSSTQDNEPSSNVIATETSSTQDDEPSNNVTATETSSTQDDEPSSNVTATETSSTWDIEPSNNVTATETSSTRDDEPSSNVTATETSSTQDDEPSNNVTATETSSTQDDEPSNNVTATETSSKQDDEPSNNVTATETSSTQDDEPSNSVTATETSSTQDDEPSSNVTPTETSSTQDAAIAQDITQESSYGLADLSNDSGDGTENQISQDIFTDRTLNDPTDDESSFNVGDSDVLTTPTEENSVRDERAQDSQSIPHSSEKDTETSEVTSEKVSPQGENPEQETRQTGTNLAKPEKDATSSAVDVSESTKQDKPVESLTPNPVPEGGQLLTGVSPTGMDADKEPKDKAADIGTDTTLPMVEVSESEKQEKPVESSALQPVEGGEQIKNRLIDEETDSPEVDKGAKPETEITEATVDVRRAKVSPTESQQPRTEVTVQEPSATVVGAVSVQPDLEVTQLNSKPFPVEVEGTQMVKEAGNAKVEGTPAATDDAASMVKEADVGNKIKCDTDDSTAGDSTAAIADSEAEVTKPGTETTTSEPVVEKTELESSIHASSPNSEGNPKIMVSSPIIMVTPPQPESISDQSSSEAKDKSVAEVTCPDKIVTSSDSNITSVDTVKMSSELVTPSPRVEHTSPATYSPPSEKTCPEQQKVSPADEVTQADMDVVESEMDAASPEVVTPEEPPVAQVELTPMRIIERTKISEEEMRHRRAGASIGNKKVTELHYTKFQELPLLPAVACEDVVKDKTQSPIVGQAQEKDHLPQLEVEQAQEDPTRESTQASLEQVQPTNSAEASPAPSNTDKTEVMQEHSEKEQVAVTQKSEQPSSEQAEETMSPNTQETEVTQQLSELTNGMQSINPEKTEATGPPPAVVELTDTQKTEGTQSHLEEAKGTQLVHTEAQESQSVNAEKTEEEQQPSEQTKGMQSASDEKTEETQQPSEQTKGMQSANAEKTEETQQPSEQTQGSQPANAEKTEETQQPSEQTKRMQPANAEKTEETQQPSEQTQGSQPANAEKTEETQQPSEQTQGMQSANAEKTGDQEQPSEQTQGMQSANAEKTEEQEQPSEQTQGMQSANVKKTEETQQPSEQEHGTQVETEVMQQEITQAVDILKGATIEEELHDRPESVQTHPEISGPQLDGVTPTDAEVVKPTTNVVQHGTEVKQSGTKTEKSEEGVEQSEPEFDNSREAAQSGADTTEVMGDRKTPQETKMAQPVETCERAVTTKTGGSDSDNERPSEAAPPDQDPQSSEKALHDVYGFISAETSASQYSEQHRSCDAVDAAAPVHTPPVQPSQHVAQIADVYGYSTAQPSEEALEQISRDFVDRVLGSSIDALLKSAASKEKASGSDEDIRDVLNSSKDSADSPVPVFGAPAVDSPSKGGQKTPEDNYQLSDGRKIEGYSSEEEYLDKDQKGVAQVEIHESADKKTMEIPQGRRDLESDSDNESVKSDSSSTSSDSSSSSVKSETSRSSPTSPRRLSDLRELDDATESEDIKGVEDGVTVTTDNQETVEVVVSGAEKAQSEDQARKVTFDDPNFMKPRSRSNIPESIDDAVAKVVADVETEVLLEQHMEMIERESNASLVTSDAASDQHPPPRTTSPFEEGDASPVARHVRFERPKTAKDPRRLPPNMDMMEEDHEAEQKVEKETSLQILNNDDLPFSSSSESNGNGDTDIRESETLLMPITSLTQDVRGDEDILVSSVAPISTAPESTAEDEGPKVAVQDADREKDSTTTQETEDSDASVPKTTELNMISTTTTTTSSTAQIGSTTETIVATETVTISKEMPHHHHRPKSPDSGKGHHSGTDSDKGDDKEDNRSQGTDRSDRSDRSSHSHRSRSDSSSSGSSSGSDRSSSRASSNSGHTSTAESEETSRYSSSTEHRGSSPQYSSSSPQHHSSSSHHHSSSPSHSSPQGSLLSLNDQAVILGLSGVNLDQKKVKQICQHIEKNEALEEVILKNTELGELEVQRLAFSLKHSAGNIRVLNFSRNKLDVIGAAKITDVLKVKPSVECLSMAGNPIGDEGVKALVDGLLRIHGEEKQSQFIKKLALEDSKSQTEVGGVSSTQSGEKREEEPPKELTELLGEIDELEQKVKQIGEEEEEGQEDSGMDYRETAPPGVEEKTSVSEFTEQLIDQALRQAMESLSDVDQEKEVKNSVSECTEQVVNQAVIEAMESLSDVETTTAKGQGETDDKLKGGKSAEIVEEKFCRLQQLDVREIGMTDVGAGDLAVLLAQNTQLWSLNMSGNKLVSEFGWQHLAKGLEINTNLERLTLDHCQVEDSGVKVLTSAIKDNTALRALSLVCCGLTEQAGRDIVDLLKRNTYVMELHLMPGNDISDRTLAEIRNYLALNQNMMTH